MKTAKFRLFIFIFSLFFGSLLMQPHEVMAATSCTASVSPQSVLANVETAFSFSITNTGDGDITYIKLTAPSSNFSMINYGVSGWTTTGGGVVGELYGNSLTASATFDFNFSASSADVQAASEDWTIQVLSGSDFVTCTGGPFGTEISGEIDTTPPTLSDPAVANITNTSATISWTTNEAATSFINYGTTTGYGDSSTDATPKTSHTITLTDLTANTTYFYEYGSVDASGNSNSIPDYYSFTTTTYSETTTVTVTETVTVQATTLPVVTKTIIIRDTTAPAVVLTTDVGGVYDEAPTIKGKASDGKGIIRIHYSVDGGRNWLPVDELDGEEEVIATFSFTPIGLLDGNYEVKVRALDPSNNAGFSKGYTMIIDRLPPRVGSVLLSIGPQPLKPTREGLVYGLRGVSQRVTLSSVGGATSIDLITESLEDKSQSIISRQELVLGASQQMYSLAKNTETGLWSGVMNFAKPGLYTIVARAVDGAKNKTQRDLQTVYVLDNGRIWGDEKEISDAQVKVYVFNQNTKRFVVWNGDAFLQMNPQKTTNEGKYALLLPPGRYYMEVSSPGYRLVRTPIFSLSEHAPINTDFHLEKLSTFTLFGKEYYIPSFFKRTIVPVSIEKPQAESHKGGENLIGKEVPFFVLSQNKNPLYGSDLVGKPTVLSFLTTWSPLASDQLVALDRVIANYGAKTVGVFVQETSSFISLFAKRGGYSTQLWADEDGDLVEQFSIHSVPTHIFIDSKGIVKDVVVGFLSEEELVDRLY